MSKAGPTLAFLVFLVFLSLLLFPVAARLAGRAEVLFNAALLGCFLLRAGPAAAPTVPRTGGIHDGVQLRPIPSGPERGEAPGILTAADGRRNYPIRDCLVM